MFQGFKFWRGKQQAETGGRNSDAVMSSLFNLVGGSPMENPDDLAGSKGIKIYRKMYDCDPEIASSHEEIILSALANGWDIECDSEDEKQEKIADFVRDNFKYLGGQNESGVVIQTPEDFIFELFTLPLRDGVGVWEINRIMENGQVWIDNIKAKPAEDFQFVCDPYGNLQQVQFNVWGITDHDPRKFLIIPWMPHFCNHYGQSRYRRLYACYWISEVVLRMAAQYAEKRSGGTWIAKYPRTQKSQISELLTMLKRLSSSGIGVIPDDITLELERAAQTSSGGDFWFGFLDRLKYRIRRGMLGLETTASAGATGDKSGQESRDESVKRPLVNFIGSVICSHINQQLIQPLVDYNFGPQESYPTFALNPPPKDARGAAEIASLLYNVGVTLPVSEIARRTGWDLDVKDGEPVVSIAQIAAIKGTLQGATVPDGIRNNPAMEYAERDNVIRLTRKSVQAQYGAIDRQYQPPMLSYVDQIIEWGLNKLNSNYETWKTRRSGINDLSLPYLGKLRSLFQQATKAYFKAGAEMGREQIKSASEYKRTYAEAPTISDDYATFQGDFWWKSFTDGMKAEMTRTFNAGFEAGLSLNEMQESFQKNMSKFGPMEFTDRKGRNRPDWYEFNRQYRNAASASYNAARAQIGDSSPVVIGYRFVAVMDDRTTPICKSLDGLIFPKSDPRASIYKPPLHHDCRSALDYIFDWERPTWSQYPDITPQPGFGGVK